MSRPVAVAVLLLAVAAALADLVLTQLVERRVAARLGERLGIDVSVELSGWPVTVRAFSSVLPAATVHSAEPSEGPLRSATLDLRDVDLDLGWRTLVSGGDELDIAASTAELRFRVRPGVAPFGGDVLAADLHGLAAELGTATSTVTAERVRLVSQTTAGEELADGRLGELTLTLIHPQQQLTRTVATAADGRLQISRDAGTGALPLDVGSLDLDFSDGRLDIGPARRQLAADRITVQADDVPFPDSDATLTRLDATLPTAVITPTPSAVRITTEGATFVTVLDEDAANTLWPYPGTISFADGTARLALGPLGLDVEVEAAQGGIALLPVVPSAIRSFVDVRPLVVTPNLPGGAAITDVDVRPGVVELSGTGDVLVLPVAP